jgi:hypothetical protein
LLHEAASELFEFALSLAREGLGHGGLRDSSATEE